MATSYGYAAFGGDGALYGFFDDDVDYAESEAPPDGTVVRALFYTYGDGKTSAYIPAMKAAHAVTKLHRRPMMAATSTTKTSDEFKVQARWDELLQWAFEEENAQKDSPQ